ncbi:MAG: tetratricopeptide repeat protein [Pseudomonadota bacterium]
MLRFLSAAAAAALISTGATAQVQVIGSGFAKECYEAAETSRSASTKAIDTCSRALRYDTLDQQSRAGTHVNRGVLRMRAGYYDDAIADFERALDMRPELGEAFLNRGAAHIYRKDYVSALPDLNQAIDLNSRNLFAAYYNRGIVRENLGDVSGAFDDFNKALELRPGWRLASNQLQRFRRVGE